jgi:hypothetical protein
MLVVPPAQVLLLRSTQHTGPQDTLEGYLPECTPFVPPTDIGWVCVDVISWGCLGEGPIQAQKPIRHLNFKRGMESMFQKLSLKHWRQGPQATASAATTASAALAKGLTSKHPKPKVINHRLDSINHLNRALRIST